VRFVIDIDGRVKQSTLVSSDASISALGACVARAYLGLQFPPPPGGTVNGRLSDHVLSRRLSIPLFRLWRSEGQHSRNRPTGHAVDTQTSGALPLR
jgi:hypothetical protein